MGGRGTGREQLTGESNSRHYRGVLGGRVCIRRKQLVMVGEMGDGGV